MRPTDAVTGVGARGAACSGGSRRKKAGETASYTLTWKAAIDDVTASSEIVYDVYTASTPGGEDFSKPTWTTSPGVAEYETPPIAGDTYFVVRARDQAGNEDQNKAERLGENICL